MPSLKPFGASLSLVLGLVLATQPIVCQTKPLQGGLVVVPSKKLPQQAHEKGESMDLVLVNPDTLYLYVEHENGRKIAIFDVSDPHKMKFKKVIELNAPAAFDFVQPAGESLEMIRYRDGRGIAILDLSKPKNPVVKEVGAAADEYYIVPTGNVGGSAQVDLPQDYQIIQPSTSNALVTVKAVVQAQTDEGNGTTYLLGEDGLTVIRNVKAERRLAATAPHWTNTIDDN